MGAKENFIRNRVNLPTVRDSAGISQIPAGIRTRAFFSARVAEAHILDRFRQISDDYSSGRISRDEARHLLMQYARANGKDDGTDSMKNLASTARLKLILDQNAKMAHAVGEHERMYSASALKIFPYVRYHASVGSAVPRSTHQQYDGMVFDKRDPWLRTHTPPWEFGCNCQLEQITAKEAGKTPVHPMTPPDQVRVESSGFAFDPHDGFLSNASSLTPLTRKYAIDQMAEAVKKQQIGKCGVICKAPTAGAPLLTLPGLPDVQNAFAKMQSAARAELLAAGLNPNNLPDDYQQINNAFAVGQRYHLPKAIAANAPSQAIVVGQCDKFISDAAGITPCDIVLERGNKWNGILHLWRDHKDIFADSKRAAELLQKTIGNPDCRVVVGLEKVYLGTSHAAPRFECLKRVVVHNSQERIYCVMTYDERSKTLKLVSWHNEDDSYGDEQWSLQ